MVGSLIVDFPSHPRKHSCAQNNSDYGFKSPSKHSISSKSNNSVRFSEDIDIKYIDLKSEEDKIACWFSRRERRSFEKKTSKEIHCLRKMISDATYSDSIISHNAQLHCIGTELFISQKFSHAVVERRINHRRTVVNEHLRQVNIGNRNEKELARVSARISSRSKKIAHHIAINNAQI